MIKFFSCNKNEPTELSPMDKNRNLRVNLIIIKEKNTWHESFASEDPCHKNNLRQICFQQYVYQQLHVWSFMQMFQVIWVFWESFFFYMFIPYQKHFRFPIALKLNFQILSSSRVYAVISLLFFNCRCATVVIVIFWQKLLKQTFVWNYCNCRSLSTFLVPLSCFSFMLMPV